MTETNRFITIIGSAITGTLIGILVMLLVSLINETSSLNSDWLLIGTICGGIIGCFLENYNRVSTIGCFVTFIDMFLATILMLKTVYT